MKIKLFLKTIPAVLILLGVSTACRTISTFAGKSGTLLNVEVKTDESNLEQITESAVGVLQNRLNALGAEGEVRKTLPNRIEIKIYGERDVARIKEILLAQSKFELRKAVSPPSPNPLQTFPSKEAAVKELGGAIPANRKVLPYADRSAGENARVEWVIVENPAIVDGRELRDAFAHSIGEAGENYQIAFSLTRDGGQKFGDWTGKNINNYVAIVLNDEVKSSAYIRSQIFDQGQIDGRFTRQAAEDLALIMKSGFLPATFQVLDEGKF